jgi:hypothetical protein
MVPLPSIYDCDFIAANQVRVPRHHTFLRQLTDEEF